MSRHFILIACLVAGGFVLLGPVATDDPNTLLGSFEHPDHDQDEIDFDAGIAAIEVPSGTAYDPTAQLLDNDVSLLSLLANSTATTIDVAGVQRDAAGSVIDAPPGSLDAALTGMQHDAGGTVRNTVSPDPTPSPTVEAAATPTE